MTHFDYNKSLDRPRTVILISGLALLSTALWFPKESLLHGAGVLIGLIVLVGVRYGASSMTAAWISSSTAIFCIAGSFVATYDRNVSLALSILGALLAVLTGIVHVKSYVQHKNRTA